MRAFSSRSANPFPPPEPAARGTAWSPQEGFGVHPPGEEHHSEQGTSRCSRGAEVKGVTAAVPPGCRGAPAAGPSPACPSVRALLKPCPKRRQLQGNLVLQEKHKTQTRRREGDSQTHQNLPCPALGDQETASKSNFPPHFSQFRVLKTLQSFFPSFSKHLPGSTSARLGGTDPTLCPWQDARPGWDVTPSPALAVGWVPRVPAPLSLRRAEPAPAPSGIRQRHRVRGSLCCGRAMGTHQAPHLSAGCHRHPRATRTGTGAAARPP